MQGVICDLRPGTRDWKRVIEKVKFALEIADKLLGNMLNNLRG